MRYEFEVGDYVKIIANKTLSSKPIGYIGQVLRIKMFAGFGVCCALDSDDISWSQFSDLAPATQAEYKAYYKIEMPKYVECIRAYGNAEKGKIYDTSNKEEGIRIGNGLTWEKILIEFKVSNSNYFIPSTRYAFEQQNKPKPKFKVGDKVKLIDNSRASRFKIGDVLPILEIYLGSDYICYRLGKTNSFCPWANESDLELYTEPRFNTGDWVWVKRAGCSGTQDALIKYKDGATIGFNHLGIWTEIYNGSYAIRNQNIDRLADESEVKKALLAEADRRGFKPGVDYMINGSRKTARTNPEFYVNTNSKYNLHCGYGCGFIYKDSTGEWATIIPDEKTLCGHKVVKSQSSSIIDIGCKSISKGEVQGFLNVCEKFDITKVMSGYVKDKSITLGAIKKALN